MSQEEVKLKEAESAGVQKLTEEEEKSITAGTQFNSFAPQGISTRAPLTSGGSAPSGGCIVTTAALQVMGKGDDCDELNLFRSYRDNWLLKQPDGHELVMEYYQVAPEIVKRMNEQPDSKSVYASFWQNTLVPCISLIESGKNEEAKAFYNDAILELKNKYMN